ncbi:dihydroxyacetone kinase DhaL subunit [Tamaricihabitans halophyticus]|uniref:Dihydroxyacetone kinase DhaL subunit n=1 Tax=Tamaricihabitans halophyticus TaxID=1262583 RepID=A0A4R2RBB0_9PSEU|nr:dihydroxyacetone kinase subunit DhaL [Tamaricihabitans halophyticus]TCP56705.1 dihydroxyacetone kinase DhaL subunit [Tamaricihabitans halophyticus]
MDSVTAVAAREWISRFAEVIDQRAAELTELDRQAGDGDYGTNLRSALRRTRTNLAAGTEESAQAAFTAIANAFLHTGGTSGPLFGVWFREFAKAAHTELTATVLADAAQSAVDIVRRLGKAEVGHKTMVDAMVPAATALRASAEAGADAPAALAAAAAAAHAGADGTADQLALRGRASYVGEHARGVVDPGARTVALFFDAARPDVLVGA